MGFACDNPRKHNRVISLILNMSDHSKPTIIVPARLASVRFPKKLLAEIHGKPLILHTADRLRSEVPEFDLFFAVDGDEIALPLQKGGYETILTNPNLASGTDRVAEANEVLNRDTIINVQADEPTVSRSHVLALAEALEDPATSMSTLAVPFHLENEFSDPNQVKVVLGNDGSALYFSRSAIPYDRDAQTEWRSATEMKRPLKHLGMYGYKKVFLETFAQSEPGQLERLEKLEQLRALEMGFRIAVRIVEEPTLGIDQPQDLEAFKNSLA